MTQFFQNREGTYTLEASQNIEGVKGVTGASFLIVCDEEILPVGTRDSFLEYEVLLKFLQNYTAWLKHCRDTGMKTF
jgi:hypothetical protein